MSRAFDDASQNVRGGPGWVTDMTPPGSRLRGPGPHRPSRQRRKSTRRTSTCPKSGLIVASSVTLLVRSVLEVQPVPGRPEAAVVEGTRTVGRLVDIGGGDRVGERLESPGLTNVAQAREVPKEGRIPARCFAPTSSAPSRIFRRKNPYN